jgi:uncharacterized protein
VRRSAISILVEFEPLQPSAYVDAYFDLKEALEQMFGRSVDFVSGKAVEMSRNYIRKRHILTGAESVYAAPAPGLALRGSL